MSKRQVNERQLEVLRWIADGCPAGAVSDTSYRTSAVALRNRGLATLSKRGGWHAQPTDAGLYYLEHGAYPGEQARPPRPPRLRREPRPRPPEPASEPEAPAGDDGAATLAPATEEPQRVRVPQRLGKPHPLVVEFQAAKRNFGISKSLVPRALRIIQGLATAFEAEGWTVVSAANSRDRWGRPWDAKDLFVVDTGELREGIRLGEENDRTAHAPTAHELRQKERYSYTRIPEWDYHPSGRIYLEIDTHYNGRRHRWSDRQRWHIEEKLDQLLVELEERSVIEREKRIERELKEAERQAQVDLALAEAKVLLIQQHRTEVLLQRAEAWQRAELVRRYLDALHARVETLPDEEQRRRAAEWLAWAERRAEQLDPLNGGLGFPEEPEATAEALAPFLPAWLRRGW